MRRSVLIIDDSKDMGAYLAKVARGLKLDVSVTDNADDFIKKFETHEPDVVVMDIIMPNVDGLELLQYLSSRNCRARIIVLTGYSEIYLHHAKSLGDLYGLPELRTFMKPVELHDLEEALLEEG
jgi:CheY-like chemotaxis protein